MKCHPATFNISKMCCEIFKKSPFTKTLYEHFAHSFRIMSIRYNLLLEIHALYSLFAVNKSTFMQMKTYCIIYSIWWNPILLNPFISECRLEVSEQWLSATSYVLTKGQTEHELLGRRWHIFMAERLQLFLLPSEPMHKMPDA